MKYLAMIGALLVLNSCNTTVGMYRDVKGAYQWTAGKFTDGGSGGSGVVDEEYGAPIY